MAALGAAYPFFLTNQFTKPVATKLIPAQVILASVFTHD